MALTGNNGDNETNIKLSKSINFALFDENTKEIEVKDQSKPLTFWIAKDTSVPIEGYKYINAINATQNDTIALSNGDGKLIDGFLVNGFNLSASNASIHIQIKPENKSIGYLTLVKFGDNPSLKFTHKKYNDLLNFHCPSDLIKEDANNSFYLIFANMSKINGFKGYVGFSIKEINLSEINCDNKSANDALIVKISTDLQNQTANNSQSFGSSNFWLRIYSAGCYYLNTSTNDWSSYGMEILSDTNLTHTHCVSNHLTTFAGGFIVLPAQINFNYVWANASFLQNPVIYSTVIFLVCLYVLIGIWARYMDSRDNKKVGITLLGDQVQKENKYIRTN